MDDQDRVSQASSVATISYFTVTMESDGKVQTFGKRCQSAQRDPNCSVVIRGWLNKKDSSGLKLWKRRWFVLSNFCLFYYKDSREESVLGSIPLPSYKILFCTPRECKNRKFTFKVVHQGMRSYFFSADTQEDMLGWVRALSQSAAMEPDSSMYRRCSSYQDFTQIGGSCESVDFPKSPSDGEGHSQKQRHVSRTLSEPSQLTGGRMSTLHTEQRGRRRVRQRNSSPSARTPSPPDFRRRRAFCPNQEEDSLPYISGQNTPPTHTEIIGTGSLISRGQLGSRPHTPVGRVDIRPEDDPAMVPETLYYIPASPKMEFKSTPNTPVTERWQNINKPTATYGSVHHIPSGRRPLGKSFSTGAHADLLPPLPPSSRAAHAPHPPQHHHHHHHHHRSHLSVCVLPPALGEKHKKHCQESLVSRQQEISGVVKVLHATSQAPNPDQREMPPIRPLESDADAVLTRLCGCDKLLQSLSVELAQLQMDKDSVHCALEVSRLQLDEWNSRGPQAQEEALTQKALLQEELVTIRARMCDVSLEMELVWSQYERMESELSVIRSHLQHICNFGLPQEQSQAQRELWMMEDILSGLKVNRDHFRFLLGLQTHHMFQSSGPHPGSPGSPGSPTERVQSGLSMNLEETPIRPPLPQELQESNQNRDQGHGWAESPYEGIYSLSADHVHRGGNNQPEVLNVKAQKDTSESQASSKWNTQDTTTQSTKKMKMSEEEQMERMKRNQERMTNRKKPPLPAPGVKAQSQSSRTQEEAPFPLRVTRVVTAVLPSSLVARRVSVEDPPPELDTLLSEQIPPEMQERQAEPSRKNKPLRRLLPESPNQSQSSAEMHQDQPGKKTSRLQSQGIAKTSKQDSHLEVIRAEPTETSRTQACFGNGNVLLENRAEERPSDLLTSDMDRDLCLTPEQREAKLRRVERIRQRVMRSAVRESATANSQGPIRREGQEVLQVPYDTSRKQRATSDHGSNNGCYGKNSRSSLNHGPAESPSGGTPDEDKHRHVVNPKNQVKFESKAQHRDYSQRAAAAAKIKHPSSPYHISSITVYQKEVGKGFTSCKDEEEMDEPAPDDDDDEGHFSSSNVRSKWFLSTNHRHGFIPLQIPGLDTCNEEFTCIDNQPACPDDVTDADVMSATVCQSLEKMKENHSLFYKIACDISISDSDITRHDGNSNSHMSPKLEEEEELLISESVPDEATHKDGATSDQESKDCSVSVPSDANGNSLCTTFKASDSTVEPKDKAVLHTSASPATEAGTYEEILEKECKDVSKQENQLKVNEIDSAASVQNIDPDEAVECAKTREGNRLTRESEEMTADQERSEEPRKSSGLCEENKETVQELGNNSSITPSSSLYEGGRVIRSASFGKSRVTVLRTSL